MSTGLCIYQFLDASNKDLIFNRLGRALSVSTHLQAVHTNLTFSLGFLYAVYNVLNALWFVALNNELVIISGMVAISIWLCIGVVWLRLSLVNPNGPVHWTDEVFAYGLFSMLFARSTCGFIYLPFLV